MTLEEIKSRRAAGATLRELAEIAHVSISTLSGWLSGEKTYLKSAADFESDLPKKKKTLRKCMTCRVAFWSDGAHHRLCSLHRKGSATPFDSPHAVQH